MGAVLITGASSGIGEACTLLLDSRQIVDNLPPEGCRLYEPLITSMLQFGEKISRTGVSAQKVAETVAHALTAKRPKTRYPRGADAPLKAILEKWVPAFIRDWLILRVLGVPYNL